MAELAPKKQRNCAIDFWRVLCTLAVATMHFHYACEYLIPEVIEELDPFCTTGGYVLGFFLLTGGYFMVASYRSKQRRGLTDIPAEKQASEYNLGRWKTLFPALLVGMIVGYIQICYTNGYSLEECYTAFNLNLWDFTGLHATNAMALPYSLGGNAQYDNINFNIATQVTTFDYPLWYISAILISSIAMYYLLAKNEGLFKCVIAPYLSVTFLANFAFAEERWAVVREATCLGLPIDIMWVVGGMSIGALTWYFVDFLKQKKLGKGAKIGLTILNVAVSVQWIYMIISNFWATHMTAGLDEKVFVFNEQINMPYQIIIIVCCMLNHDYLTDILNRPFLAKLGEYSLYFFVMHYPVVGVISHLAFRVFDYKNEYYLIYVLYLVVTIIAGILCELLCKKVLNPIAAKFFSAPKKVEAVK